MPAPRPPRWRREAADLEQEHPVLYPLFLGYARRAKAAGLDRFCARRLLDDARAEGKIKIGNWAGPLLARLLLERHPEEFGGWIKVKRGGVDEADGDALAGLPGPPSGVAARTRLSRMAAAWDAARPAERRLFLRWVVERRDALAPLMPPREKT